MLLRSSQLRYAVGMGLARSYAYNKQVISEQCRPSLYVLCVVSDSTKEPVNTNQVKSNQCLMLYLSCSTRSTLTVCEPGVLKIDK
jgi:hypothetical protein